ncbi:MAG: hypothetical protein WC362_04385 [Methanoregula sp.]|jgi:mRNA-degrading endonuclease RelE of RelBE toxin-antitoxin system
MAKIAFIDEETKLNYFKLETGRDDEPHLFVSITHLIDKLREIPFFGTQVKKDLFPKEYKKYNLQNLWKFNLSKDMRLTYTITSDDKTIVVIIIEWFDHKKYDRRFGY